MNCVTIDVETANPNYYSICQIGIAKYQNGELVSEWKSFIDPEDYFDQWHIHIHSIDEKTVRKSPKFPDVIPVLKEYLADSICVSHMPFDRVAIARDMDRYGIPSFDVNWLDSAKIARRTWKQFAQSGYGLANICSHIGYKFHHHDALEDAKAAAAIVLAASRETGLDIRGWLERTKQPISGKEYSRGRPVSKDGNPEGALYGETICFTGALRIPRADAADLAARIGCNVGTHVTKNTTILVVGEQDLNRLAGKKKSSKHRKAEKLIENGQRIRIMNEIDFYLLLKQEGIA